MNKQLYYLLLPVILFMAGGCKQQTASETNAPATEESHVPLPPKYTAHYDCSVPPARIDVERAISDSVPVNLSKIASTIQYFLVGDDKYPITDVVSTGEGFIALNQPKLYYYRQGVKRKRVGLKTEYGNWDNTEAQKLYFDSNSKRLYTALNRIGEDGYRQYYIAELPPLDSVLARVHYLYPDSLPVVRHLFPINIITRLRLFSPELFTTFVHPGVTADGIRTYNLSGDTICSFHVGIDSLGKVPEFGFFGNAYEVSYWFDKQITFKANYCDTIYRITNENSYNPVYSIHLGKYRASATYLFNNGDRKNKAWLTDLKENKDGVFLKVYKEGKTTKSGWLAEDREPDGPSVERQIVYLKSSGQTLALPFRNKGLTNDLDGGIAFWPEGQTDGYLYMIRPAKEFRASVKLDGSPKQKALKAFLEGIDEKQNVMIVVK